MPIDKISLKVQLYDANGDPTNKDLKELLDDIDLEKDYLNEHFVWDSNIINVTILDVPDNNTIVLNIDHNEEDILDYVDDFLENQAPFHDYLSLFYEDDESYQCALELVSRIPYPK